MISTLNWLDFFKLGLNSIEVILLFLLLLNVKRYLKLKQFDEDGDVKHIEEVDSDDDIERVLSKNNIDDEESDIEESDDDDIDDEEFDDIEEDEIIIDDDDEESIDDEDEVDDTNENEDVENETPNMFKYQFADSSKGEVSFPDISTATLDVKRLAEALNKPMFPDLTSVEGKSNFKDTFSHAGITDIIDMKPLTEISFPSDKKQQTKILPDIVARKKDEDLFSEIKPTSPELVGERLKSISVTTASDKKSNSKVSESNVQYIKRRNKEREYIERLKRDLNEIPETSLAHSELNKRIAKLENMFGMDIALDIPSDINN